MPDMPVRRGLCPKLEEQADALVKLSLSASRRPSDHDILTPWKDHDRRRREVYVSGGVPDPAVRRGDFRRAYNPLRPELNSREGVAPPRADRSPSDGWSD